MSKRKRGPPPPERMGNPLLGLQLHSYTVGSWCPTPDGSGTPEAVAVAFDVLLQSGQRTQLVLRLKTPDSVDRLIQCLLRHKREVWPESH